MTNPIQSWRRQKKTRHLLGKIGKVVTWTKIFVSAPEYKEFTPYPVVMVELENGEKVYGQMVDYEEKDLHIGQQVESVLRIKDKGEKEGVVEYGVKFKPIS
jgi:uncharacterized protein